MLTKNIDRNKISINTFPKNNIPKIVILILETNTLLSLKRLMVNLAASRSFTYFVISIVHLKIRGP